MVKFIKATTSRGISIKWDALRLAVYSKVIKNLERRNPLFRLQAQHALENMSEALI